MLVLVDQQNTLKSSWGMPQEDFSGALLLPNLVHSYLPKVVQFYLPITKSYV